MADLDKVAGGSIRVAQSRLDRNVDGGSEEDMKAVAEGKQEYQRGHRRRWCPVRK